MYGKGWDQTGPLRGEETQQLTGLSREWVRNGSQLAWVSQHAPCISPSDPWSVFQTPSTRRVVTRDDPSLLCNLAGLLWCVISNIIHNHFLSPKEEHQLHEEMALKMERGCTLLRSDSERSRLFHMVNRGLRTLPRQGVFPRITKARSAHAWGPLGSEAPGLRLYLSTGPLLAACWPVAHHTAPSHTGWEGWAMQTALRLPPRGFSFDSASCCGAAE